MSVVRKTSPVGVDLRIDKLQNYLYNKLSWTDYESYHRAYKNQKEDSLIPEVYTSNGNYEEVYFNDNYSATSFFLVDDFRTVEDGDSPTVTVSLVYQVKLDSIYSTTHRADEELINDITNWIMLSDKGFELTGVVTGVRNVYSELNLEMPKNTDMSNFFVCRFDMSVLYSNC